MRGLTGLFGLLLLLPLTAHAGVKGDLNDDGVVDLADALLLSQVLKGNLDPQTLSPEGVADVAGIVNGVGGDDQIDVADLLLMMRAMGGVDLDADGLTTEGENAVSTSPFLADTEGDGWLDGDDPDPLVFSPPGVPATLRVFDGTADVELMWGAPSGETAYYLLHRYGTDGSYEFVVANAGTASYLDTTAQAGVVYRYWIEAVNTKGQQGEFVSCDVNQPANPTLWLTGGLGPHPNPWFTASAVGTTVTLTWESTSDPTVTEYVIYSTTTQVELGEIGTLAEQVRVSTPALTHQLPGLTAGTHYFRITASTGITEGNLASAKQVAVVVN